MLAMCSRTSSNCFSGSVYTHAVSYSSSVCKIKMHKMFELHWHSPLHPMSTSMPNTCTISHRHKRQRIKHVNRACPAPQNNTWSSIQYHQLIPRMQYAVNEDILRKQCAQSLENIRVLFDIAASNTVLQSLQQIAANPAASHTTLFALFFIVFNLDITLKQQMLKSEPESTQRKIGHFAVHLRDKVIPEYMAKEATTEILFVDRCMHAWDNS